jgi:hypothetical protein
MHGDWESRNVRAALVMRLDDILTGYAVTGDRSLKVASEDGFSWPVVKPDGYIVFAGARPEAVRITSERYQPALIGTGGHAGAVLRLSLIPRGYQGKTLSVGGEAHVGFAGNGEGYALSGALPPGSADIAPQKDDFRDITDQYHALVPAEGEPEAVYITKNLGGGRYALKEPLKREIPARGTRLIPLRHVMGGEIPVPPGAGQAYVLQNGKLAARNAEAPT